MGEVVDFTPPHERFKLVRCRLGHEYADLAAAVDLEVGVAARCRECGEDLDCVYSADGTRRLPAVAS